MGALESETPYCSGPAQAVSDRAAFLVSPAFLSATARFFSSMDDSLSPEKVSALRQDGRNGGAHFYYILVYL